MAPAASSAVPSLGSGDINGDGYADIVIAASRASQQHRTRLSLFRQPVRVSPAVRFRLALTGPDGANGCFGTALPNAGDVNGDGYADLIVGDNRRTRLRLSRRCARDSLRRSQPRSWPEATEVSSAGDVNGDGYADIISGSVGVSRKRSRGLDSAVDSLVQPRQRRRRCGSASATSTATGTPMSRPETTATWTASAARTIFTLEVLRDLHAHAAADDLDRP